MKCPLCAAAGMIHDVRDLLHTYKGKTTLIPSVEGDFCPACQEMIINTQDAARAGLPAPVS
ncbi:type II toxin-antitoxin system MqsA family antitoxin [Sodalis sp. RH21]|uniref:type II toxin-antitoxin system MqsA family antitoxin n=1 Tax=unclassified Sodalis (in: enterobacteria) TaxID=2636512 RepID=UPI0039B4ABF1